MYLVRYEEIKLEDAVEILRESDGWLDGDSRCVVAINPLNKGGKNATDMAKASFI